MKRRQLLILFLLVLAAMVGYLLSKASLVGRAGISLFYQQYRFLKIWWQAGLVVFILWMIFFFLQAWVQRRRSQRSSRLIHTAAILFALLGLYLTYLDFRHTISHRWLGERFHLGGYLFWIGWITISVFFLTEKRETTYPAEAFPNTDPLRQPDGQST
jgi:hypothetical protein